MSEAALVETWLHQVLDPDPTLASLAPAQLITVSATGGTFTLTYGAQTTSPIAYNAPAIGTGSVQAALEALSSIGAKNTLVRSESAGAWCVVFLNNLVNITAPITGSGASLTGPGASLTIGQVARVYADIAPQGTPFPYVLMTNTDPGQDVSAVGAIRVMVNAVWVVRGVGQGQQYTATLKQIADRIDALLHQKSSAITGGGTLIASYREQPFRLPETTNGINYRHLGGQYRTLVQA
jgi:hypothetical protein